MKNVLEEKKDIKTTLKTTILLDFKISCAFLHLFRTEKSAGNFKILQKSIFFPLLTKCFQSTISLFNPHKNVH